VWVTHDLAQAERIADRMVLVEAGRARPRGAADGG